MRKGMNMMGNPNTAGGATMLKAAGKAAKDAKDSARNFMSRASKIGTVLGGSLSRQPAMAKVPSRSTSYRPR